MKIICGLGNPGKQYEYTHHNMGFLVIDKLADHFNVQINKLKFKALIGETHIGTEKVILVKPQTFMNLSGEAVRDIMNFYKANPEDLLVIYDDIDIPLGTIRMRAKGSAGTHNGMKSIIYQLQYDNFPRLRVGLGGEHDAPLINFVLQGISRQEAPVLEESLTKASQAAEMWVREGLTKAVYFANSKSEQKNE